MAITQLFTVAALTGALLQGAQEPMELIGLLDAGDEAALRREVSSRPDAVRAAMDDLFVLAVQSSTPDDRVRRLLQAEELAQVYEGEWSDPFFVRRIDQFKSWSPEERLEKLEADSVRQAGRDAFYEEGAEAAIRLWERSLSLYRALDDPAGQAAALGNLGAGYYVLGQPERALRYHGRSLELAEGVGDHRTRANALGNIASVHKDWGDLAFAAEYYGRALGIRPLTGDRRGQAADYNNLGLIRDELGDLRGAEEYFRQALDLNRSDGRLRESATNLTNLANIGAKMGRYDDASKLYAEALAVRRETGDRRGEAHDLRSIGLLHLRWGDYPAAVSSLESALAVLEEIGPPLRRAVILGDLAAVHSAMGKLDAALQHVEQARAVAGAEVWSVEPDLVLVEADLLTDMNDLEAAAELYRTAKDGFQELQDPWGQAEAEHGLGSLYMAMERYDAAEEALIRARLIQESLPDPRPAALTLLALGDVQLLNGDTAVARTSYRRALAVHESLGDRAAEAASLGAVAELDRAQGSLGIAAQGYRTALERLEGLTAPTVEWPLHLGLGLTLRDQGRPAEAASELRHAISGVEAIGASLTVEEQRYGYLEDKWSAYAELVAAELTQGHDRIAFQVSEEMRARQLLDLLARGRLDSGLLDETLVREEQTLRRRIGQLARVLDVSGSTPETLRGSRAPASGPEELAETVADAQARYQRLLTRLRASHPDYASLVSGPTATVEDLQTLLPPDAVFIEYLVSDDHTIAFVVSREDMAAIELPIGRKALRQLVDLSRGTIRAPEPMSATGDLWRTPLRRLYQTLIAPLEGNGHLDGRRLLIVAPHAELHYVPFQALLKPGSGTESYLVESFDIAYVPSASVWLQLTRRERPPPGQGLLAMAPQPGTLSQSAEEVRAIGHIESGAEVVVGSRATEGRFGEIAPRSRVIHLATYGVLNTLNPLFSFIELMPDGNTDGRLEVHEVFGLRLAAELVVLSACQTALGSGLRRDVPPGDDWVGLVQAFLYAGAETVLGSLWPVDDEATARLMGHFYQNRRAGQPLTTALANAQRALLGDPDRANPFFWAAFVLSGDVR